MGRKEALLISGLLYLFKIIVRPKMREVNTGKGMYRTVMTSHTIAEVLGQFKGPWLLILQQTGLAYRIKSGGLF
jgi:hypothetical protein